MPGSRSKGGAAGSPESQCWNLTSSAGPRWISNAQPSPTTGISIEAMAASMAAPPSLAADRSRSTTAAAFGAAGRFLVAGLGSKGADPNRNGTR